MGIIIQCIVSILAFAGGVILVIFLNKRKANKTLVNLILSGIALFFYILMILFDGVYHKWDLEMILDVIPLSRMSPFIFATVFFINFVPQGVRKYYHTILSTFFLAMASVGMFSSLADGLMNDINYFVVWMYFDSFSHLAIALLGLWLVLSGQVTFERKTLFKCLGILYVFLFLLIIVNLIFKTNFFGFSVYGDHNIYNIVINPWLASFAAYFAGLTVIVVADWLLMKAISKKHAITEASDESLAA